MNLENELRKALCRVPPPSGFAGRVIAQAGMPSAPKFRQSWWKFRGFALANASALIVGLIVGGVIYQRRQEQRALEAGRQLLTALSVTKASLHKVQERMRRVAAKPVL